MKFREFQDSRVIRAAGLFALASVLVLNMLFANLHLSRSEVRLPITSLEATTRLPSPDVLAGAFLNYRGMAADLVWIQGLIYYGEQRRHARELDELDVYADTVSELDPYFYKVYRWFADLYLTASYLTDDGAIETANSFLERGMRYFPTRHELPFTAALNNIGYSPGASPERRLREVTQAIGYLHQTARTPDAPSTVAGLLDWFYNRKRQLEVQLGQREERSEPRGLSDAQKELYIRMYLLAPDEGVRERIVGLLQRHGVDEGEVLEHARRYDRRLQREHRQSLNYLPVDLWTTVADTGETHE